jgi:hypothetical protein
MIFGRTRARDLAIHTFCGNGSALLSPASRISSIAIGLITNHQLRERGVLGESIIISRIRCFGRMRRTEAKHKNVSPSISLSHFACFSPRPSIAPAWLVVPHQTRGSRICGATRRDAHTARRRLPPGPAAVSYTAPRSDRTPRDPRPSLATDRVGLQTKPFWERHELARTARQVVIECSVARVSRACHGPGAKIRSLRPPRSKECREFFIVPSAAV